MKKTTTLEEANKLFDNHNNASGFIQWKGTDVCLDFHCPKCCTHNHYDDYFAYTIQCGGCKTNFALSPKVEVVELTDDNTEPVQPITDS